jgi:hypothetical protein
MQKERNQHVLHPSTSLDPTFIARKLRIAPGTNDLGCYSGLHYDRINLNTRCMQCRDARYTTGGSEPSNNG